MTNLNRALADRLAATVRLALRSPSFWLVSAAVALYIVFSLHTIQQPGLYTDNVDPDYLVVQIANPSSPAGIASIPANFLLPGELFLGRFPVLGGVYYGSYTSYEALPFYILLGGTMLSIRIAHMFLGLLVLAAAGLLLRETTRSAVVTGVTLLLLAVDPAFLSLFRTQAYIAAFPVCLTLLALYAIYRYPTVRGYLVSGALLGLSVFGYFVYLFAIPGVLIFALRDPVVVRRRGPLLGLIAGIAIGVSPYAFGYGLMLSAMGLRPGLAAIVGLVHALSVNSGQSYLGRVLSVAQQAWFVATGEWEWLRFWSMFHVDYGQALKCVVLVALPLLVIAFLRRYGVLGRAFSLVGMATASFLLFATVFGGRLGGHDLSAIVPLLYVLGAISVAVLISRFPRRRVAQVALAGSAVLCVLNAVASGAVITRLSTQGAFGYYSSVISAYPEEALAHHDATPHAFLDWGAMMPFIYLTEGKVPVFDDSQLQQTLCEYGRAKLVLVGSDALNPSAVPRGVTQDHVELLRDAHSGFPYKIVTVSPSGRRCPAAKLLPGQHLPAGVDEAAFASTVGVYPGVAPTCCFLSDRALFRVRTGANARWLTLDVFVPNYAFYKEQRLTVRIDGKFADETGVLGHGAQTAIHVPLPTARISPGFVWVEITPSYWFVPRDVGLNGGTYRLSVVLTSVTAGTSAAAQARPVSVESPTPLPLALFLPQGIARADAGTTEGIYAADASMCCFLSDRAAFTVRGTAHARELILDVFVPGYAFYGAQRLTVRVDGKVATETSVLRNGAMNAVSVPLPARRVSPDSVRVEVLPSYTFVPKDVGLNADTARLSVILRDVKLRWK